MRYPESGITGLSCKHCTFPAATRDSYTATAKPFSVVQSHREGLAKGKPIFSGHMAHGTAFAISFLADDGMQIFRVVTHDDMNV